MNEAEIVKVVLGLLGPVSSVVAAILILALVGLGTYLRRYLDQKALQLATREDFQKLQKQVADSTRLVEGIKSELANNDWIRRELHNLRIKKVEELVTLALNCFEDVHGFRNAAIEGKHYDKPRHHDRMLAVALVYLPELEPMARDFWLALGEHYNQLADKAIQKLNDPTIEWDNSDSNFGKVISSFENLKRRVAKFLQETANGTVFRLPA